MAETDATLDFWKEKFWTQKKSPWHLVQPHKALSDYQDMFLGQNPVRVLVPLCGKSVDLKWLYDQGHEVVGVEGVTEPIEEFFETSGLKYEQTDYGEGGHRYQTADKRLTILKHNFFTVGKDYEGYFDCVWDRAAMVAIDLDLRELFAKTVKRLVKPNFRYLCITVEYDQAKVPGPPFALSEDHLKNIYGSWANVEKLGFDENMEQEYISEQFKKAGVPITQGYYLMQNY